MARDTAGTAAQAAHTPLEQRAPLARGYDIQWQITGRLQNGSHRGMAAVLSLRASIASGRSSGDVEHGQPSEGY